jgi:ribosome biogenesis GTPase A
MLRKKKSQLNQLKMKNLFLTSAISRTQCRELAHYIQRARNANNVFVAGAINSGKSTLINSLSKFISTGGIRVRLILV